MRSRRYCLITRHHHAVGAMVQFQRQNLTRYDLPDDWWHVFSWGVVVHFRKIDKALDELARADESLEER